MGWAWEFVLNEPWEATGGCQLRVKYTSDYLYATGGSATPKVEKNCQSEAEFPPQMRRYICGTGGVPFA
jgi:hypothetical protein